MRLAINGFGRIGRLLLRAIQEYNLKDLEVVAVNSTSNPGVCAHLFKWDSVHGPYKGPVDVTDKGFNLGAGEIKVFAQREPLVLPWGDLGIDLVLECTGDFVSRDAALKHIEAGAKKVLISAPAKDPDITIVYGVNDQDLKPEHRIISSASCTTNCLAPVASVLHKTVGIERGFMTTIHAYTGDQRLVDGTHKDLRRARSAALSIVPTSTGAARSVEIVLPALKGKLDGTSIRVPVANVSAVDFCFDASKSTSIEDLNNAFIEASQNNLKGVLDVNHLPLVSTDFNHNPYSAIVDLAETKVMDGKFCRILAWYDNEWGFSMRMLDTARLIDFFRNSTAEAN